MIGVACLNPAVDITYQLPSVNWSGMNRPSSVHARPGGKGLNVARTLQSLEVAVLVMGLAGGINGAMVAAALDDLGVPATFTTVSGETRRTFAVVDTRAGDTALFSEPGPDVTQAEFAAFCGEYKRNLPAFTAVVLSGSLPCGLPAGSYATLIGLATAAGVPVLLDAHGEALLRGAAAGPAIVKPNLAELEAVADTPLCAPQGADRAVVAAVASRLRGVGAQAVVTSLGPDGLLAVTEHGCWHATPPAAVAGNPTGAGDGVVAGLAHGLVLGRPWEERLRHAVALGTATAAAPVAGEFDLADYLRLLGEVTVHREETC